MNKKFFKTLAFSIILILIFAIPASAWKPENHFWCNIEGAKIPDGTAYIDLLLPIKEKDECYTPFNEKNGEKFAISKDSEIVNYNEDGYKSYTFHVVDADSKMCPYYHYTFTLLEKEYEQYKDLLTDFEIYCNTDKDNYRYYDVNISPESGLNPKIKDLQAKTGIEVHTNSHYIAFNDGYERETEYDFDYMRIKYKFAKMAYLDADGNIIEVSNTVKINQHKRTGVNLNLKLSGLELTEDASTGPPVYLIFVIPMVLLFAFVCGAITFIIVIIKRKNK